MAQRAHVGRAALAAQWPLEVAVFAVSAPATAHREYARQCTARRTGIIYDVCERLADTKSSAPQCSGRAAALSATVDRRPSMRDDAERSRRATSPSCRLAAGHLHDHFTAHHVNTDTTRISRNISCSASCRRRTHQQALPTPIHQHTGAPPRPAVDWRPAICTTTSLHTV